MRCDLESNVNFINGYIKSFVMWHICDEMSEKFATDREVHELKLGRSFDADGTLSFHSMHCKFSMSLTLREIYTRPPLLLLPLAPNITSGSWWYRPKPLISSCCCCPYLEQSAPTYHVHTLNVCFPRSLQTFFPVTFTATFVVTTRWQSSFLDTLNHSFYLHNPPCVWSTSVHSATRSEISIFSICTDVQLMFYLFFYNYQYLLMALLTHDS